MAWYVILDRLSIENLPSGGAKVNLQTLRDGKGNAVVPVFTSEARCWKFAEEWRFGDGSVEPFPMPFDLYRLGELLRLGDEEGEKHLITVDPFVVVEDDWASLARSCSVEEFCLFLEKLRPVTRELTQKGLAKFGYAPEHAAKIISWMEPQLDDKVGDLMAVVREHLVEDNN